jgi:hypothetical protein
VARELYLTVEGPRGKAEVFETVDDHPGSDGRLVWEPRYEIVFRGETTQYGSEGEAITVAHQVTGAPDNY